MGSITEERKETLLKRYGGSKNGTPSGMGRRGGFGGPPRGGMAFGKPKNAVSTISKLLEYIGKDKAKIIFSLVCVIISSVASLAGSYLLRPIINGLIKEEFTGTQKLNNLITGLLIMAAVYLAGVACSYLQQRIMIGVSQSVLLKVRGDLFTKAQKLPLKYHDTHTHGDIMSRFTNDLDAVGEMLNNTMQQIVSGAFTLIGTVVLMFVINWMLACVMIVIVPLLAFAGRFIGQKSRKYFTTQQQSLGAVNGYIEETISGQKVIKVFNHEETAAEEFAFLSDELRQKQMKAQFFGGIMGPVLGNLGQVSYAVSATVGGILCLTANFDIGGLTAFTNYSRHFSRPISELSLQMNIIYAALAGAERVFEVMEESPEKADEENGVEICSGDCRTEKGHIIKGEVVLKDVSFGYVPGKTVLKHINVTAGPGEKIAFVGSTGAGKTTITNLINRFYEIDEGEILIDGINIKNIKKDSLRGNIAMVLQDTHLFSGTVRENIRYGRPDATDDEVELAAKVAYAQSFIERLPEGYDTLLDGDGANLSQGERQLLNIARAAISKAPILILDEATSSVDTRTEKFIEKGMDRLMKNRTTFVIAHRLSTVRNADRIVVLEQGEIIEEGTHQQLLDKKGRYYQLYTGLAELD